MLSEKVRQLGGEVEHMSVDQFNAFIAKEREPLDIRGKARFTVL